MADINSERKKVFISYSWVASDQVLELAKRLRSHGVDVILDKWDLEPGQDKYSFMEKCVNDESIDKVLMMCEKIYQEKANGRKDGVGDETQIISPEIYSNTEQKKFIPIILEKNNEDKPYIPSYLKSRIYIDLSNEDVYESEYERLLRFILDKPEHKKPPLGNIPKWIDDEKVDFSNLRSLLKQIKGTEKDEKILYLMESILNEFPIKLLELGFEDHNSISPDVYLKKLEEQKGLRDILFDFFEIQISKGVGISDTTPELFENLFNIKKEIVKGRSGYASAEIEIIDYFVWESFIGMIAILLQYKKYSEIYEILNCTYFLEEPHREFMEHGFTKFRPRFPYIEGTIKSKSEEPTLFSLAANIMIKREKKPHITKSSLVQADVLLWQIQYIFTNTIRSNWFPYSYVYSDQRDYYGNSNNIRFWTKLKSKKYCEKIAPMFGVENFEEIKELLTSCGDIKPQAFSGCFDNVSWINTAIKIDEIGILS